MALIEIGVEYEQALEETKFPPLPEADYEGEVVKWELTQSAKGNPQIQWDIDVVDKPDGFENIFPLRWWTPTTGRGKAFLTKFVEACQRPWSGTQLDPDTIVGCRIRMAVVTGMDGKGKKINKIDAISSL